MKLYLQPTYCTHTATVVLCVNWRYVTSEQFIVENMRSGKHINNVILVINY
jgi:hypothetical protein